MDIWLAAFMREELQGLRRSEMCRQWILLRKRCWSVCRLPSPCRYKKSGMDHVVQLLATSSIQANGNLFKSYSRFSRMIGIWWGNSGQLADIRVPITEETLDDMKQEKSMISREDNEINEKRQYDMNGNLFTDPQALFRRRFPWFWMRASKYGKNVVLFTVRV